MLLAASSAAPPFTTHAVDQVSSATFGNVVVAAVDMVGTSPGSVVVERMHRSMNPGNGWFGKGWAWRYDAKVELQADGSLQINDYDADTPTTFIPKNKRRSHDVIESEILDAAQRVGIVAGAAALQKYRLALHDESFMISEWAMYRDARLIVPVQPRAGEIFFTAAHDQALVRLSAGYQRAPVADQARGTFEAFDDEGRLRRAWDQKHQYTVTYDRLGEPVTVSDELGNRISIEYNDADPQCDFIKGIHDDHGHAVKYTYSYNGRGASNRKRGCNLTAVEVDGRKTRYVYDPEHRVTSFLDDAEGQIVLAYDVNGRATSRVVQDGGPSRRYSYVVDTEVRAAAVSVSGKAGRDQHPDQRVVYLFGNDKKGMEFPQYSFESTGGMTTVRTFDESRAEVAKQSFTGSIGQVDGLGADAYYRIGDLLRNMQLYPEALSEYQRAADLRDGRASAKLASMYLGEIGVGRDCAKAAQFLERALAAGYSDAAGSIGQRLRQACPPSP